jgi:hypothetical protein
MSLSGLGERSRTKPHDTTKSFNASLRPSHPERLGVSVMPAERCLEPMPGLRSRGRIYLDGRPEGILCVTLKANPYGAKIEVCLPKDFPSRFSLMVSEYAPPRPCKVLWRIGDKLGVLFTA